MGGVAVDQPGPGSLARGRRSRASAVDPDRLFEQARVLLADYRQAEAERVLRRILARIDEHGTPAGLTRERVLLTLANVRAERGHLSQGLELLDEIAAQAPGMSGLVASQRGLMFLRAGRLLEALTHMDAAVIELGRAYRQIAKNKIENAEALCTI